MDNVIVWSQTREYVLNHPSVITILGVKGSPFLQLGCRPKIKLHRARFSCFTLQPSFSEADAKPVIVCGAFTGCLPWNDQIPFRKSNTYLTELASFAKEVYFLFSMVGHLSHMVSHPAVWHYIALRQNLLEKTWKDGVARQK